MLSLASVAFLILAAQFGSSQDLGSFVLGLSTAVLIQSLARAVSGETLLVRSTRGDFHKNEIGHSFGLSLLLSLGVGVALVCLALLTSSNSNFYLSLAVAQFGLLLQDSVRFAALAKGSTVGLLVVDMTYTLATCSAIFLAGSLHSGSQGMLTALGATAGGVGLVGAFAFGVVPRFGEAIKWLRSHWRLNSSFVAEAILGATLGYSITLILNFFASSSELAAYRSALSIFGMTSLAINFLRTIVLRDLRESGLRKSRSFWRKSTLMSALVILTVGFTYLVLALIPDVLGIALFGETWLLMTALFAATALNRIFAGLSIVPTIFLRVQGITWHATAVRIGVTVVGFGLGPVGALIAGAQGALLAEGLSYFLLTIALMALSRNVAARGRRESA